MSLESWVWSELQPGAICNVSYLGFPWLSMRLSRPKRTVHSSDITGGGSQKISDNTPAPAIPVTN